MNETAKKILEIIHASNLATGVDVSRYNGGVDFNEAEFEHTLEVVDYCMVRASSGVADGTIYIDPALDKFYVELEEHPHVIRDFYHYLSSHSAWTKQYDVFMNAIDGFEFEWLTLDGERIYNVKSSSFAYSAYSFMKQLIKDFPTKKIKFYSNKYDYMDWFDPHFDFDGFLYHHAQYPWYRWDNVSSLYLPQLYQTLTDIFVGTRKPNLPLSRINKEDDYEMWQVGAYTGIGLELGFEVDFLDVNVSKKSLPDFRIHSGLYSRWNPGGTEPPSSPTLEERVEQNTADIAELKQAVFG